MDQLLPRSLLELNCLHFSAVRMFIRRLPFGAAAIVHSSPCGSGDREMFQCKPKSSENIECEEMSEPPAPGSWSQQTTIRPSSSWMPCGGPVATQCQAGSTTEAERSVAFSVQLLPSDGRCCERGCKRTTRSGHLTVCGAEQQNVLIVAAAR